MPKLEELIELSKSIAAKWGYVVPQKKEDNSRLLFKELKKFLHGENVWV